MCDTNKHRYMSFRAFYTHVLADRKIRGIERFKKQDGFVKIWHYPAVS